MNRGKPQALRSRPGSGDRAKTKDDLVIVVRRARRIRAGQGRVLAMLARGSPLEDVLAELIRTVEAHARGMLGSVLLVDAGGERLRHGAAPRLPPEYNRAVDGVPIAPSAGSCGTAAWRGRRVVVEDIANDPLWADYRDLALRHGLKACWSQPILSTDGRVLGTFAMYYRRPRVPSRSDVELIEGVAHLAGIAMERHEADETRRALERRLRAQGVVLAELAKSEELAREDFPGFARLAVEKAAATLGVERVSVWLFSADRSVLSAARISTRRVTAATRAVTSSSPPGIPSTSPRSPRDESWRRAMPTRTRRPASSPSPTSRPSGSAPCWTRRCGVRAG